MIKGCIACVLLLGIAGFMVWTVAGGAGSLYETVGEIRLSGMGGSVDGQSDHRAVATRAGFVYVVLGGDRLSVFDGRELGGEADPVTIDEPIRQFSLNPGKYVGLVATEDRLYCYGWGGGEVFDISDPSNPVLTGAFGDPGTHVFDMVHHDGYLAAACYDRLIVYTLDVNPDYPMVTADLPMEADTYAYAVCVADERLCATGFRRRRTGTNEYWLGTWDFSVPERVTLLQIVETTERGYRMVALDGMVLAISESQATLWRVDGEAPVYVETVDVSGKAIAQDGEIVILDRVALTVAGEGVEILGDVDCPEDRCHVGLPRIGAADAHLVLLPRTKSVAILRPVGEG